MELKEIKEMKKELISAGIPAENLGDDIVIATYNALKGVKSTAFSRLEGEIFTLHTKGGVVVIDSEKFALFNEECKKASDWRRRADVTLVNLLEAGVKNGSLHPSTSIVEYSILNELLNVITFNSATGGQFAPRLSDFQIRKSGGNFCEVTISPAPENFTRGFKKKVENDLGVVFPETTEAERAERPQSFLERLNAEYFRD